MFELWLEEAVHLGMIEAPDFYDNKAAYCRCRWIGPGRGWIDPTKEAEAASIRMDYNLSTLEAECAEQGLDWEEVLEQRATEKSRMAALGLTPAERKRAGQAPPPEPNRDDEASPSPTGDSP